MGASKVEHYPNEVREVAAYASVLAHPARVEILYQILNAPGCISKSLEPKLQLSQATISQHLKVLKEVGLLKGTIEGTSICYCIDTENWKRAKQAFTIFFRDIDNKICCD